MICEDRVCISGCPPQILKQQDNHVVLAITEDNAKKGGCTECLICEFLCWEKSQNALKIDVPPLETK
ncbi:hypothetical protein ACFL27_16595 [candidate division CSSED10-310 bacterium]|uniref:4Fe-4S ferredoxin-type domain-containing protein n=1 Tax=candidate division CSSED10-310 bacterium TaxID=2855610 RepID=A0ABV6Z033_UNCC1